ncbi:MAG: Uncharacterized protein LiPW15_733 [Parcubacteria group bacterium LiPW_15]|nr:MAG: Uncharacterized protein LiPW15_733 [Parcubacteria group bacterium LiPW_15]
MENESFNIFLGEKLRDKNISIEKLSELSGISIKYLENMLKGDPEQLPPAPYLRGYFVKLGEILNFDGEEIWKTWNVNGEAKRSGSGDRLPENRFARKPMAKYIWLSIIPALLIIYFTTQLPHIFGTPLLYIEYPKTNPTTSLTDRVTISGTLQNGKELYINNEMISVEDSGAWEKGVLLQSGQNNIEIRAKKFLGREIVVEKQIFYEAPANATTTASSTQKTP